MIILTIIIKPYNYIRAIVYQCTTLITAFCIILTTTIFRNLTAMATLLIINTTVIIIVLIIGVVIMKKFPEKLFSEKKVEISSLFLFQFCKDYRKYVKDSKRLKLGVIEEKYRMVELSRHSEEA